MTKKKSGQKKEKIKRGKVEAAKGYYSGHPDDTFITPMTTHKIQVVYRKH
jgi:hypothetical protein